MLLSLLSCYHSIPPSPPKRDISTHRFCDAMLVQNEYSTAAIYLTPTDKFSRIPVEAKHVDIVDMVSLVNNQGTLFFNDFSIFEFVCTQGSDQNASVSKKCPHRLDPFLPAKASFMLELLFLRRKSWKLFYPFYLKTSKYIFGHNSAQE